MTAAIYFHPEAYTTSGPTLMGRNAAGASFLRGLFNYREKGEFWIQVEEREHASIFDSEAREAKRDEPVRAVDRSNLAELSQPGVLYYPGPDIANHAWLRSLHGHGLWSLCGVTHTTSSARIMDAIAALLVAPVQPWDALICTSKAVKDNVRRVLAAQQEYLAARLHVGRVVLPQLPVIPLGIHTTDFEFSTEQRSRARLALSLDEEDLAVLYVGRLSFHAKAHPLAMYQALERAARNLPEGRRVVLIECGWHATDQVRKAYEQAARMACPSIRTIVLDGRVEHDRQVAWAVADVFCSLADNIQESFGLTPIEAMAAGLPVVVSDWDGYRDSVRHGVDGFRIPTSMAAAGLGTDLAGYHALKLDSYDMYCGHASSFVAVDIDATAAAFRQLFASAQLRQQMGEAGRQRARQTYDWSAIIPRYEELWRHLTELRVQQRSLIKELKHPWPARMDPFAAFGAYPSSKLTPQSMLVLARPDALQALDDFVQLAMVKFAKQVLPTDAECRQILGQLVAAPQSAGDLVQCFPPRRQRVVFRGLIWLAKLGLVKFDQAGSVRDA